MSKNMKEYCGTFKVVGYVDFFVEAENETKALSKIYDKYYGMSIGDFRETHGELTEIQCLGETD